MYAHDKEKKRKKKKKIKIPQDVSYNEYMSGF